MPEGSEAEGKKLEEKKELSPKEEKEEKDVEKTDDGEKDEKDISDKTEEGGKKTEDKEEEKKNLEELKKKYADWPMKDIKEPHENDVMYGRGGGTNHHAGNKRYRKWVDERKVDYVNSKRLDKPLVALAIIRKWREQVPPGRFLKLDEKTGLWHDVGDKKAREKTSQALRENAPKIRQGLEEKVTEQDMDDGKASKSARFSADTKDNIKKNSKPALARDHSLGREYLQPGEAVALDGFSWDPNSTERLPSYGEMGSGYDRVPSGGSMYSRGGSFGNMGPPPPPPDYFPQQYPPQQYDSWGRMPSGGPPPPVPQMYGGNRSADFDREHSLATNPLQNATMDHSADKGMFEQRGGSGYWGPPPSMGGQPSMPPPQMSSPSPGYDRCMSGGNYSSSGQQAYDPNALPMNNMLPPQVKPSNYQVSSDIVDPWSNPNATQFDNTGSVFGNGMGGRPGGNLVRPDMVKRMTSNQNEDLDTKRDLRGPSIKRATLSRDSSAAAARLKELQFPNMPKRPFNTQEEINFISSAVEQSTLVPEPISDMNKPELERTSTVDEIARVLGPPEPLSHSNRSSTVDALLEVTGMNDQHISRPPTLRTEGRLSTAEYLDIVNEPIGLDEADARNTKPIDLATLDEEADNVSKWLGQG